MIAKSRKQWKKLHIYIFLLLINTEYWIKNTRRIVKIKIKSKNKKIKRMLEENKKKSTWDKKWNKYQAKQNTLSDNKICFYEIVKKKLLFWSNKYEG